MVQQRRVLTYKQQNATAQMTKKQDRKIPTPQKRHQGKTMLVRVSDGPPHQEDRYRKHQRLSDDPGETETFAAEARVDLADQEGPDDPPLDLESAPEHRPLRSGGYEAAACSRAFTTSSKAMP